MADERAELPRTLHDELAPPRWRCIVLLTGDRRFADADVAASRPRRVGTAWHERNTRRRRRDPRVGQEPYFAAGVVIFASAGVSAHQTPPTPRPAVSPALVSCPKV